MTQDSKPYYITAAIPYVNGAPHLGHAYELVAADTLARFRRADGYDVRFTYGVSEHGQKIAQTAETQGRTPAELCEEWAQAFYKLQSAVQSTNTAFVRTSEARHKATVTGFWNKMVESGDLYPGKYSGWYSVRDEAYYLEDETHVKGDGVRYGPQGTPVEWVEADSYFFRLSAYTDRLLKYYEENPDFIQPETRRNETIAFVKSGLRDLSMSRTTFTWGIQVPNDPGHVMYVWPDELAVYISSLGAFTEDDADFRKYWPANVHIIGKDIVRFHTVYWPAFLMACGEAPPKIVHGHGFIYDADGQKMSKSLGNVIDPFEMIETYGLDAFRYYVMREIAYGQDGKFNTQQLPVRVNADLANEFGNLAQRCLSMIAKECDGKMPEPGPLSDEDKAALAGPQIVLDRDLRKHMEKFEIHRALEELWRLMSDTNGYFANAAPWTAKKEGDFERMRTILWATAQTVRQLAILASPFIPVGSGKILDLLSVPENQRSFADLGSHVPAGEALPTPQGVYPRIDLKAAS